MVQIPSLDQPAQPAGGRERTQLFIAVYEVTNALFNAVMAGSGSDRAFQECHADWPAQASFEEAVAFCDRVQLALPTEAEWAAAAGAGDGRAFPWGDADPDSSRLVSIHVGHHDFMAVGSCPAGASPFGVHDMAGSVWEWCSDAIIVPGRPWERVIKGGGLYSSDRFLRIKRRHALNQTVTGRDLGFRPILRLPLSAAEARTVR